MIFNDIIWIWYIYLYGVGVRITIVMAYVIFSTWYTIYNITAAVVIDCIARLGVVGGIYVVG